jgi:multidrug efflux system membrane fusion protein
MALVGLGLLGWRQMKAQAAHGGDDAAAAPLPVAAVRLVAEETTERFVAVGALLAARQVLLAAEIDGRIVAIRFVPGSRVAAGDLLLQLDDAPERAQLASAQARARFARTQWARSRQLLPLKAESRARHDQSRFDFESASAEVGRLKAVLAQKAVRAPFAGEIGIRRVDPGQVLVAGQPIATLADQDSLRVRFAVPQKWVGALRPGLAVQVSVDAHPARVFSGVLNVIEPAVDAHTRSLEVEATLPNPEGLLRPGMHVRVALDWGNRQRRIPVPATAVTTSLAGDQVAVIEQVATEEADIGTIRWQPVETRAAEDGRIVLLSGVREGEIVVITGQTRLAPGLRVKARLENPAPSAGEAP